MARSRWNSTALGGLVSSSHHHPVDRPIEDPSNEPLGQFTDRPVRRLLGDVDEGSPLDDVADQPLLVFPYDVQERLDRAVSDRAGRLVQVVLDFSDAGFAADPEDLEDLEFAVGYHLE